MSNNAKLNLSLDELIKQRRVKAEKESKKNADNQGKNANQNTAQGNQGREDKQSQPDSRKRSAQQAIAVPNKRRQTLAGFITRAKRAQNKANQGWNSNTSNQGRGQGKQHQQGHNQQHQASNLMRGRHYNNSQAAKQAVVITFADDTILEGTYGSDDDVDTQNYQDEYYVNPSDVYGGSMAGTAYGEPSYPTAAASRGVYPKVGYGGGMYAGGYALGGVGMGVGGSALGCNDAYEAGMGRPDQYPAMYRSLEEGRDYMAGYLGMDAGVAGVAGGISALQPIPMQRFSQRAPAQADDRLPADPAEWDGRRASANPDRLPQRDFAGALEVEDKQGRGGRAAGRGRQHRSPAPRSGRRSRSRSPRSRRSPSPRNRRGSRSPPRRKSRSPHGRQPQSRSRSPFRSIPARGIATSAAARTGTRTVADTTLPPRSNNVPTTANKQHTTASQRVPIVAPGSRANGKDIGASRNAAPPPKSASGLVPASRSNLSSKKSIIKRETIMHPGDSRHAGHAGAAFHASDTASAPESAAITDDREYSPDLEDEERAIPSIDKEGGVRPADPRRGSGGAGPSHRAKAEPQGEIYEDGGFIAPPTLYRQGVQEAGDDLISLKTVVRPDSGVLQRRDIPLPDVAYAVLGINTVLSRDALAAGEIPTVLSLRHMLRLKERMEMGELAAAADTLSAGKGAHQQAILILSAEIVQLAARSRQMINMLEYGRDIKDSNEALRRQYEFILHQLQNNLDWSEIFDEVPQFYTLSRQDQQTVLENLQRRRETRAAAEAREQAQQAVLVAARIMAAPAGTASGVVAQQQ